MSRIKAISSSVTVNLAEYVGLSNSRIAESSSYPPQNALKASGGTGTYAVFTPNSLTYSGCAIYKFGEINIPSDATITSVGCKATARARQNNRIEGNFRLYSGNNPKGNILTFNPLPNSTTNYTLNVGSWTADELKDVRLYYGLQRIGNTTEGRLYGATLGVSYSCNITEYEISFGNQSSVVTTSPSTTQYVAEGGSQSITFDGLTDLGEVSINDNGTDVSSSVSLVDGNYTYTISNIQDDHIITILDNPSYICTSMSSHDTATIFPATLKVYDGKSAVFTINGDVNDLILRDNGVDVTNLISNGNYTITNVHEIHSLTLENKAVNRDWIKIQNQFRGVKKIFKKIDGEWAEVNKTAFDTYVSSNIVFYGGNIEFANLGVVEKSSTEISISINDNALTTGTYKLIYENENKEPIPNVDKITEFTV